MKRVLAIITGLIILLFGVQHICIAADEVSIVTVDDNLTRLIFNNKLSDFKAEETVEIKVKLPETGKYGMYIGPSSVQAIMKVELADEFGQELVNGENFVRIGRITRVQPEDNAALVLELNRDTEYTLRLTASSDLKMRYIDFRCLEFDISSDGGVLSPLDYMSVESSVDSNGDIIYYTVPNIPTLWSKQIWPTTPKILGDYLDVGKLGDTIYGYATAVRGATTEYCLNFKEAGKYKITLLSRYSPDISVDDQLSGHGVTLYIDEILIGEKKYQNTIKDKKKVDPPSQNMEFGTIDITKGEHVLKLVTELNVDVYYFIIEKLQDTQYIESEKTFSDVHDVGHWSREAVDYVYSKGFMNGVSDTLFEPEGNLTRAMFVTVIYRMEGQPEINMDNNFIDVEKNSYYEKAVTWGRINNIVNGVSADEFNPAGDLTREQLATMIYRYAVFKGLDLTIEDNELSFLDTDKISEYAITPVKWAVENDIFPGLSDNYIHAGENATRGQAAYAFMKLADKLE